VPRVNSYPFRTTEAITHNPTPSTAPPHPAAAAHPGGLPSPADHTALQWLHGWRQPAKQPPPGSQAPVWLTSGNGNPKAVPPHLRGTSLLPNAGGVGQLQRLEHGLAPLNPPVIIRLAKPNAPLAGAPASSAPPPGVYLLATLAFPSNSHRHDCAETSEITV
jgi:hypothetical protein